MKRSIPVTRTKNNVNFANSFNIHWKDQLKMHKFNLDKCILTYISHIVIIFILYMFITFPINEDRLDLLITHP